MIGLPDGGGYNPTSVGGGAPANGGPTGGTSLGDCVAARTTFAAAVGRTTADVTLFSLRTNGTVGVVATVG
ncbi:MAG TPA: hypothetical protein VKT80_12555 [Chloroflexota bacterium]|nr:hypothetical protein [Chloroflexota bacterium]